MEKYYVRFEILHCRWLVFSRGPRDDGPDAIPARDPLERLKSKKQRLKGVIAKPARSQADGPVQEAVLEGVEIDQPWEHEMVLDPQSAPT